MASGLLHRGFGEVLDRTYDNLGVAKISSQTFQDKINGARRSSKNLRRAAMAVGDEINDVNLVVEVAGLTGLLKPVSTALSEAASAATKVSDPIKTMTDSSGDPEAMDRAGAWRRAIDRVRGG